MRLVRPALLVAAFLAVVGPRPAAGQGNSDPGFGAGAAVRYGWPPGAGATGGAGVELFARIRLTGVVGVEASLGTHANSWSIGGTEVAALRIVPLQLSILAFLRPFHRLQPYGLLGAGYSYAEAAGRGPYASLGKRSENQFGLHVGAGLDFRLTQRLSVGADGRWTFIGFDLLDTISAETGQNLNANDVAAKAYLTWYF